MSERAVAYVLGLGRDEVTVTQKFVLRALAEHHSERYGTVNVSMECLCEETMLHRRHLAKIFKSLSDLIDYRPGVGRGNHCEFIFKKVPKRCQKGGISDIAIKEEDLKQEPKKEPNPPNPLSSKGGIHISSSKLVTVRQVRQLRERILFEKSDGTPWLQAIESACRHLLFPLDAAIELFEQSGYEETPRDLRALQAERHKPPQAVREAG